MINNILDGIAAALKQAFGSDCTIYKEGVPQGFQEPSFAIKYIIGEDDPLLIGRRLRKYKFDIHYFPSDTDRVNTEMYSIESRLYSTLEYINVLDILFRGTKMSSEIVDGVLHFFVNYDKVIVDTRVNQPRMETLSQEVQNNGRRN